MSEESVKLPKIKKCLAIKYTEKGRWIFRHKISKAIEDGLFEHLYRSMKPCYVTLHVQDWIKSELPITEKKLCLFGYDFIFNTTSNAKQGQVIIRLPEIPYGPANMLLGMEIPKSHFKPADTLNDAKEKTGSL